MARLLVVDNENETCQHYTDELSDEGHQVSPVASPARQ